jgi:hypothetical protein
LVYLVAFWPIFVSERDGLFTSGSMDAGAQERLSEGPENWNPEVNLQELQKKQTPKD